MSEEREGTSKGIIEKIAPAVVIAFNRSCFCCRGFWQKVSSLEKGGECQLGTQAKLKLLYLLTI